MAKIFRSNLTRLKCFAHAGGYDDFIPGLNQLSDEAYARLKNHPDFLAEVKAKNFEEVKEDAPEQADGGHLEGFSAEEAKKLVAETENTPLLREWKEHEARVTVVKAIDAQLAKIEAERGGNQDDDALPTA